jgi:TRAP transporter TAXI family solute receptor
MKDGHADMFALKSAVPNAQIMEIEATHEVKVLSLDKEILAQFIELAPAHFETVVPAGSYKGQKEDAIAAASTAALFVNKNLPDDLVYDVLRVMFDHADHFNQIPSIDININDPIRKY